MQTKTKDWNVQKVDIIFYNDPDTIYDPSYTQNGKLPFYEDKDLSTLLFHE
jgi:hypothetical protein